MELILLIVLVLVGMVALGYMVGMTLDSYSIGRIRFRMPQFCHTFWAWLHERPGMGQVVQFPSRTE